MRLAGRSLAVAQALHSSCPCRLSGGDDGHKSPLLLTCQPPFSLEGRRGGEGRTEPEKEKLSERRLPPSPLSFLLYLPRINCAVHNSGGGALSLFPLHISAATAPSFEYYTHSSPLLSSPLFPAERVNDERTNGASIVCRRNISVTPPPPPPPLSPPPFSFASSSSSSSSTPSLSLSLSPPPPPLLRVVSISL